MKTVIQIAGGMAAVMVVMWVTDLGAAQAESVSGFAVREFGATGDGATKDTAAVQKAIDAAGNAGGGTVYFAPGTYVCGSLHLRNGVTLHVDAGATIKASKEKEDFDPLEKLDFKNDSDVETTYFHFALIWGEDVERIGIVGEGTIDMNRDRRHGPKTIALKRCKFVEIRGVHLLNAPNYNISMLGTDYVNIDGVTILKGYADGIDPDACRNVRIANCHIESVDDAIVPKASFSLGERRACENITVTNCYLATVCNAFKLGTESAGDFKRIAVSNCVMSGFGKEDPATSGVSLESVDGSNIDGVVISNLTMVDVESPIFIRLGNRGRDNAPGPGTLKNVVISDVVATDAINVCSITGIPERCVEGVTIANVRVTWKGGYPYRPVTDPVPECIKEYPSADMFDAMPAYAFYCRHVNGLRLSNLDLQFRDDFWRIAAEKGKKVLWKTDGTPMLSKPGTAGFAMLCDDVKNLAIAGLRARPASEGDPVLRFVNVQHALLSGCVAAEHTKTFLEIVGRDTRDIVLVGNALHRAEKAIALGEGASADVVRNVGGTVGGEK